MASISTTALTTRNCETKSFANYHDADSEFYVFRNYSADIIALR